jgi:hypothetical protein
VAVLAEESFTVEPGGLEAESHVALLFELRNGLIVRLLVVEHAEARVIGSRWSAA